MNETGVAALKAALEADPANEGLRMVLVDMLMNMALFDGAETELKAALVYNPNGEHLKLKLAHCLDKRGNLDGALTILESMALLGAPSPDAQIFKARLLMKAGKISQAVEEYHSAVSLDSQVADDLLARKLGISEHGAARMDKQNELVNGRLRAAVETDIAVPDMDIQKPKVTFSDVGGMDELKEEIRLKIIHPIHHPEIYKSYGKTVGGGILMYGPPGCGKTFLARATAGEINSGFMSVGIADVLDMWIGQSERNLHEMFESARENTPCVMFFDEVDALGASRQDMRTSGGRHLINQFLSELDGVTANNDGLLILAATNAPWHLDSAFRRPGRFDRILFVPPPDLFARANILRVIVKGKPVEDINYEKVAKKTEGFSGADLKAVVDMAVEKKLQVAIKDGALSPLRTDDLITAAKQIKPSTKEWFATARNYVLYSNQSGLYNPIREYLKL
ncbi:MAG: AAA family ATPase [Deltaproteobacteria bacterium]|nr:AAA family ATPase [Deltaproteobacteria bacterium]